VVLAQTAFIDACLVCYASVVNGRSTVTIAVDRLNPPYVTEEWGDLRGATIDLVRDAYQSQGVDVTFDPVDGVMAQEIHLTAGRADAAADFTITDRRLRWFTFSERYHVEELQLLTLKHGPIWPGWQHFNGTVGVKADSYAQEYLIRHHYQARLLPVDSTDRLFEVLAEGRAQAIVLSRITGAAILEAGTHPDVVISGAPFGPAPLALAALPEQRPVLDIFNAGLAVVGGEVERLSPFRPH
jgi:ABC-type amino acid transport substrate-binding protein